MGLKHLAANTKLKVTSKGVQPNSTFVITVNNLSSGKQFVSRSKSRSSTFISTVTADTRGVNKVTVTDKNQTIVKSYVTVGSAEIDCCIAKLVHDAINCTCKCNKCKEDLERAQTIRLLLQAAKYEATLGLTDSVQDKYNKAKELCTEVCACGC
jgi:hypothetical protein